jgi:L-asparaginase
MLRDESDGALKPAGLGLGDVFKKLPEFQHQDMPNWELQQWDPPLDSSDFTPAEWVRLAQMIGDNYYQFDGFVVLHGTDTMAYRSVQLDLCVAHRITFISILEHDAHTNVS